MEAFKRYSAMIEANEQQRREDVRQFRDDFP